MKVYLSGAIDRDPNGGVSWRRELTTRLQERGYVSLDPTAKECQALAVKAKAALATGDTLNAWRAMRVIREADLVLLNRADLVIALIDPALSPCGTYFELAYAKLAHQPVYIVVAGGVTRCPLWLLAEFPDSIYADWDALLVNLDARVAA